MNVIGFAQTLGDTFVILDNDGVDPVVGTFAGLPEGGMFKVGSGAFQISYRGGDGNDVVLTSVPKVVGVEADAGEDEGRDDAGGANDAGTGAADAGPAGPSRDGANAGATDASDAPDAAESSAAFTAGGGCRCRSGTTWHEPAAPLVVSAVAIVGALWRRLRGRDRAVFFDDDRRRRDATLGDVTRRRRRSRAWRR